MGSEIVDALVTQIGRITTNPDGLSDNPSKPIEQRAPFLQKGGEFLQQLFSLFTGTENAQPDGESTSNPVQQVPGATFAQGAPAFGNDSPDAIMQVFILESEPEKTPGSFYEGPVLQNKFGTRDVIRAPGFIVLPPDLMEQFSVTTDDDKSQPIELTPRPINTVSLTQFDFIDLIFPPCNSIKNPVDVNILWRIKDLGFDFNIETLIFTVQGSPVQDRPEFSVTAIAGGLQLDYNPPEDFEFDEEVEITLEIEDTAVPPNFIFFRCKWQTVPDTRAPSVLNVEPECNSTGVSVVAPVEFDVVDIGDGVDPDSIRLSIEGITVCSGVTRTELAPTVSGTGFHVVYEHPTDPFRFESFVTIGIEASDLSPLQNSTLFVCCFETEESEVPVFLNFDPASCASFIDNTTGLTFEVYGVEDGVDISTLEVRVDNELRTVFVSPRILRSE